jgi:hypothetical protein
VQSRKAIPWADKAAIRVRVKRLSRGYDYACRFKFSDRNQATTAVFDDKGTDNAEQQKMRHDDSP